jgi:hypothetical protein
MRQSISGLQNIFCVITKWLTMVPTSVHFSVTLSAKSAPTRVSSAVPARLVCLPQPMLSLSTRVVWPTSLPLQAPRRPVAGPLAPCSLAPFAHRTFAATARCAPTRVSPAPTVSSPTPRLPRPASCAPSPVTCLVFPVSHARVALPALS